MCMFTLALLVPVLVTYFLILYECDFSVQKLKTRIIRKNVNPEWHEDLTFSVDDPTFPIKLVC